LNWSHGTDSYTWSNLETLIHETIHAAAIWRSKGTGVEEECAHQEPSGESNHCVDRRVRQIMNQIRSSVARVSQGPGFFNEGANDPGNREHRPAGTW
jgi:hypothetical protein